MDEASLDRRSSGLFPRRARMTALILTTLLASSMMSFMLMQTSSRVGGQYLYNVTKIVIPAPKVVTHSRLLPPRQPERSRTSLYASSGQNLLYKLWDKDTFSDVKSIAYRSHEALSDKEQPMSMGLTGFNMTDVRLLSHSGRSIRVGDVLRYRIQSRDFSGRNLLTGGDMWYATLSSDENPKASTTGYIVDFGNGTYDAFLLAAWPGHAKLNITLVHASETVYYMRNTVWNSDWRVSWIGQYSFKRQTKDTLCFLQNHGNWMGKCEYPDYNALGTTVFLCDLKPGFPCSSLKSTRMDVKATDNRAKHLMKGVEYLFQRPYSYQNVPVANATVKINGRDRDQYKLPRCTADQEIPAIHGYWKDGKWTSLLCAFSDWAGNSSLITCLRGKQVVLTGDSTVRQWLESLTKLLKMKFREVKYPNGKILRSKRTFSSFNITIRFQFHPFMVVTHKDRLDHMMNEVDVLDRLNDPDCNYVVVLSPWSHFAQWTRESYIERVRLIRKAVVNFRMRCPHVPIVIKGAHPRDHVNVRSIIKYSDYYLQQIELINREAFAGIGVFYLPIWDMTLADPSPNTIHNPENVIREELRIFLGYVCDTLVPTGRSE